jgi:hypothetical protein
MVAQAQALVVIVVLLTLVLPYSYLPQVVTKGGAAAAAPSSRSRSGTSASPRLRSEVSLAHHSVVATDWSPLAASSSTALEVEDTTPRSELFLARFHHWAADQAPLLAASPQAPDFSPNTVQSSASASPVTRSTFTTGWTAGPTKQVHTRNLPTSGPNCRAPWKRCLAGGYCLNHCGGFPILHPPFAPASSSTESTPRAFTPRGGHVVAKYHDRAPAYSPLGNPSPTSSTPTARR